jgi:gliding motility-associated-like protein
MTIFSVKIVAQTVHLPLDQARYTGITSLTETGKDSFAYASSVLPPNIFGGGKLNNLTHVSLSKGVLWSFDFQYPKTSISSKLTNFKNGFLWAGFVADVNQNKSLMRLDKSGNIIWSKRYGGLNDVDTANGGVSQAVALPDGNIAFAGGAAAFATTTRANDLFLAKLDENGNQIWAKNYLFSNLPNTYTIFSNLITTNDGGYLLCGSIYTLFDRSILLLKTDANGSVQWTRSYTNETAGVVSDEVGVQAIQLNDGGFALIANQNDLLENSGQIIAQINANGTVFRANRVRVNPDRLFTLQANKAIFDPLTSGLIIGAGVKQDSIPTVSVEQNLLYKVRLDGTLDWKYNYFDEIAVGFLTPYSDLVQTKNGGFAHLTAFSKSFDDLYPILVVSDDKGITSCEKNINLTVDRNIILTSQTFNIAERNAAPAIDYVVTKTPFAFALKLPSLNLGNDTAVCKTDTNFIFNASNPDFNTYKWSTGATTPQITVNQLGQYSVTVTSTKFCLTLKDTINITKSNKCTGNAGNFKIDIPNAFTPNKDNLNDVFRPIGEGFVVQSFQIYNRWGNLVFDGNDSNKEWDGRCNGQDAASDVYAFVLRYTASGNNEPKVLSGEVTLLR